MPGRKLSTSQTSCAQNGIPIMSKDDAMQKNSMLALFNHFQCLAAVLWVPCQSSWIHSQGQHPALWKYFSHIPRKYEEGTILPNFKINCKTRFILPMTQIPLQHSSIFFFFAASPIEHLLFLYLRSSAKTPHLTIHRFCHDNLCGFFFLFMFTKT